MKLRHGIAIGCITALLGLGAFAGVASNQKPVEKVEATDYSSTIRVYFDFDTTKWNLNNIDYVRLGGDQSSNEAVMTSSDSKYNQSLGQYVKDISSASAYENMPLYFSENNTWFYYYDEYHQGSKWFSGGWQPGYEYKITNVNWHENTGSTKNFTADAYCIGEITDSVNNATVYFVDGYSWGENAKVHFWGGTAGNHNEAMADSSIRIKCYVGSTEYETIYIRKYTISGSAAYVQFNNGTIWDGEQRLVNEKVYYHEVDAGTYDGVAAFLVELKNSMGSYTYKGNSYSDSICAIGKAKAQELINTYNSLTGDSNPRIVSSARGSSIRTYVKNNTSPSSFENVSVQTIISQLQDNISNGVSKSIIVGNSVDNNMSIVTIALVGFASLSTVASFFLIKKKKEL